jgi:hypothetical protein
MPKPTNRLTVSIPDDAVFAHLQKRVKEIYGERFGGTSQFIAYLLAADMEATGMKQVRLDKLTAGVAKKLSKLTPCEMLGCEDSPSLWCPEQGLGVSIVEAYSQAVAFNLLQVISAAKHGMSAQRFLVISNQGGESLAHFQILKDHAVLKTDVISMDGLGAWIKSTNLVAPDQSSRLS